MHGDTLFGIYTFQSEEVNLSEREIAFMRVGKNITEGYGPVEDKDGKMQFMDKSKLEFDDNPVWEAVGVGESIKGSAETEDNYPGPGDIPGTILKMYIAF